MRLIHYGIFILIFFFFLTSSTNARLPKSKTRQLFIDPQNEVRAELKVGLQPLVWNKTLAEYARLYARKRRQDCALEHSNGTYGENIFWGSGDGWTPDQAAEDWVAERDYYNYQYNSCASGHQCGHYTQIVWRHTRRIGCAKVLCHNGPAEGVFMICSYDPPGNYEGERPY